MGGYSLIASERDTIRSFAESDDGALLVGTMSGVRRLANGMPETYPKAGTPFPTHALLRDRDGSLWIGTPSFEHRPYPSGEKTGTPQRLDRRAAIPRSPGRIARICREFTAARCDLPRVKAGSLPCGTGSPALLPTRPPARRSSLTNGRPGQARSRKASSRPRRFSRVSPEARARTRPLSRRRGD